MHVLHSDESISARKDQGIGRVQARSSGLMRLPGLVLVMVSMVVTRVAVAQPALLVYTEENTQIDYDQFFAGLRPIST